MKIVLIWIGKTSENWIDVGVREYQNRLKHYISFDIKEFPYVKNSRNLSEYNIKEKEGEQLLSFLQPGDVLVLLDEKGKEFSSREFSEYVNNQMIRSVKRLVFVIGGAYGFSESVYKQKQFSISLSKMTFSHQMVRVIYLEQLYRAMTIINGEPYHHE
ncbi:MAG: 23S rRNA (pseudouridine(1915)-N(3))-methyltransferase RlmH [Marinilabiliaceae bacterium]|nr:23S rRNA (pseudouridine(1915)-N(3))-methyltransferase RlmH [Marinilabiliaceae bacterium]